MLSEDLYSLYKAFTNKPLKVYGSFTYIIKARINRIQYLRPIF